MAFCTQADVVEEVGTTLVAQLCSDGAGGISATLVTGRIARADADIKSVLGPQFNLDDVDASTADIIKYCSVDISVFYMYERKPEFRRGTADGKNPEQSRYDRAMGTVREIKSGQRDMGRETAPTLSSAGAGGTVYASTQRFIVEEDEATDGPCGGY